MDPEPTQSLSGQQDSKSFWQAYGFILIAISTAIIVGVALMYAIGNLREEFTTPSTSTSQNNLYSNWKTYRNEEYGFEFRYPDQYGTTIKEGEVKYDSLSSKVVSVDYSENKDKIHRPIFMISIFEKPFEDVLGIYTKDEKILDEQIYKSDFITAKAVSISMSIGDVRDIVIVEHGDKTLVMTNENEKDSEILSTFKFNTSTDKQTPQTDQVAISNEKTLLPGFGAAYSWDGSNVYYEDRIIPGADPTKLKSVGPGYSKDQQNVYYEDRVVFGADPQSFHVVEDYRAGQLIFDRVVLARDRNSLWIYSSRILDVDSDVQISILHNDNGDNVYFTDGTFAYVYTLARGTKATILKVKLPEDFVVGAFDTESDNSAGIQCLATGELWWYFQTWRKGDGNSNLYTVKIAGEPQDNDYCPRY